MTSHSHSHGHEFRGRGWLAGGRLSQILRVLRIMKPRSVMSQPATAMDFMVMAVAAWRQHRCRTQYILFLTVILLL
jgi:hypothetical protein